jgi:hypothetical protein
VTGHPYGPNEERGLHRSVDGGATFKRVLYVNDRIGAPEVQIDPQHPNVIYAGMWQRQEAPWRTDRGSAPTAASIVRRMAEIRDEADWTGAAG